MSSEQEMILYKNFYDSVHEIFNRKNLLDKLKPLDLNHDKLLITVIFRTISDSEEEPDFMNWNDEEWIKSMAHPEICLLSFLFKKQLTIEKIYHLTSNEELKSNLLSSYKRLVRMVKFLESLEKAKKLIIDTTVDIKDLQNKQLQIALNIQNYKDPKNMANLIDLLYHQQFRDNLLINVLKGIDKIDINIMKNFNESDSTSYTEVVSKYCTQDNISKLLIFLMKIDIKGDVYANEQLYNKVKTYMNEVIQHSDQIKKLFTHVDSLVSSASLSYKNKLNLILLDNTKDIIKECNASENKVKLTKDLIKSFDSFSNGEYVKFKTNDLIKRIRDLIFVLIQKVLEVSALPKEEKVFLFNDYVKRYVFDYVESDEDFIILNKEKSDQIGLDSSSFRSSFSQKVKELAKELIDSLSADEEVQELIQIKNEFLDIVRFVLQMDFTSVDKSQFHVVFNFASKIMKKPNQLKFLLIKFLNADVIKKFISNFEKDSSLQINPEIKEQIASKALSVLKELVDVLVESKDTVDLENFILFISKGIDYAFYYAMKWKSTNMKAKVIKQKKVIG